MPLAAVIIPGLAPGATAVRSDGAATPDRAGAAAAFDALLGEVAASDARAAAGAHVTKDSGGPAARPEPSPPAFPQPDLRFNAALADQTLEDDGADITVIMHSGPSGDGEDPGAEGELMAPVKTGAARPAPDQGPALAFEAKTSDLKRPVQSAAPAVIDTEAAGGASPDVQIDAGARPAQSAIASGEAAQAGADRAPAMRSLDARERPVPFDAAGGQDTGSGREGVRENGANAEMAGEEGSKTDPASIGAGKDAVRHLPETPEQSAMPDALSAKDAAGEADALPANERDAPNSAAPLQAPQPADPAEPPAAPESAPISGSGTEDGADPEAASSPDVQAAQAVPAPAPDVLANAASVRRESEPRRFASGGDASKAGDEPAKPAQSGMKTQAPAAPQAAAPMKAPAPDMPAPQRSAEAFQALLQAQTRPAADAALLRTGELPPDPSGDAALRGGPDRAAELLRTSAPANPSAPPRFAPQTVQTLAAQIVRRQGEGGRVFDIRLDPPELGRVGVRLEMGKDQMVKAMLSAERPDTLQELQRTARDLERALAEAGLNLAENGLSFSLGGERGERDAHGSDTPSSADRVVEIDVARPGAPAVALYGFALARAAGLDIQA
ncbi:MAG: flagellar hook-length control protein FliK [Oceanicaulis sp.]